VSGERVTLDDFNKVASDPLPSLDVGGPLPSLDLDTFLKEPPPEPRWQWAGYYARGDVVLVVGDPGLGKSMVFLSNATQAALGGGEQLGEKIHAAPALFIDLESPDDVVHTRLHAFGITGNLDGFDYVHRPPGFDLLADGGIEKLRAKVLATGCEITFLDSLRRIVPGLDEADSRNVGLLFSMLRDVARELGVTIVVIHHPRKPSDNAKLTALQAARGSGDLTASVDSYLYFRKLAGGLVQVEHGKARRGREHEKVHFRIVENDDGGPKIDQVDIKQGRPSTADRLRDLRAAEPNITQAEAAKALGVTERTVREYWHEEPPPSLLDEDIPS
jgi:DNA-binding XRE family transcriptional regulator